MDTFSLDHLDGTEFEEFCYDLLGELGFVNRNWRKGTAKRTSPSDSGRDIECELETEDVDGAKHLEKWFVECKRQQEGVPPTQIQGVLAWAGAERPDCVLVIASGFLSNPAKHYLKQFVENNRPPYRIKVWERPKLEELTIGKPRLLAKHGIGGELSFLSSLHPAHLLYLVRPPVNTLAYLFNALDALGPAKRDEVMALAYYVIVNPRFRRATTGKEKLRDLMLDEVSYGAFKQKCHGLCAVVPELVLTRLVVFVALEYVFRHSDEARLGDWLEFNTAKAQELRQRLDAGQEDRDALQGLIRMHEEHIRELPDKTRRFRSLYQDFCDEVVTKLFQEEIPFPW